MPETLVAHGVSTSGSKHSLEVVPVPGNRIDVAELKFTVMGPTGKRHASVKLSLADSKILGQYLLDTTSGR